MKRGSISVRRSILIVVATMICVSSARSEESKPAFQRKKPNEVYEIVASRAEAVPTIDGDLGDECWSKATPLGAFHPVGRNSYAKQQTLAWFSFGTDALYVAVACEDNEIMATAGPRDSKVAWTMDAVELFFCPRRDDVHWFHFIFNAVGSQYDDIEGTSKDYKWTPEIDWKVATSKHSWGWTGEIRIPYATVGWPGQPGKGDVWKFKCVRTNLTAKARLQSTWTFMSDDFTDIFAVGDLIFESRNLLSALPASPSATVPDNWSVSPDKGRMSRVTIDGEAAARLQWEKSNNLSKSFSFRFGGRSNYIAPYDGLYLLSGKVRMRKAVKGSAALFRWRLAVDVSKKESWKHVYFAASSDFNEYRLKHKFKRGERIFMPEIHTSGKGEVELKEISLRLDDRKTRKFGFKCLTNNAPPELKAFNTDEERHYTYRLPGTDAPKFPYLTPHYAGPAQVVSYSNEEHRGSDGYRVGGWIPFKDGYLTDGNVGTYVTWSRFFQTVAGFDVVFDLGEDLLLDEVEVVTGSSRLFNASLYLKSQDDERYTMTHTAQDLVQYNEKGVSDRPGGVVHSNVNTVARWVRLHVVMKTVAGFSEVRIWGRPLKEGELPPDKKPYRQRNGKVTVKNPAELPGLPDVAIFPLPQRLERRDGFLPIGQKTTIVIPGKSNKRRRTTAEVLQEGIFVRTGLKLKISAQDSPGSIRLKEDDTVTDKAEGYMLHIDEEGINIVGKDPAGTFYATQSLVQIIQSDGKGGSVLPLVRILDWPATPARLVHGPRGKPNPGLLRALARFKINDYPMYSNVREDVELAERYFVKLIPQVWFNWAWNTNAEAFIERTKGENITDIGKIRACPCPSHPEMWKNYFARLDNFTAITNSEFVDINTDEMYIQEMGARWNVCPRCRARGLNGQELWVETLKKIHGHLSKRGKKILMIDSIFRYRGISHPEDKENDWRKIPDLLPDEVKKDLVVYLWHDDDPALVDALARNKIAIWRWRPQATFPGKHFPGQFSGFYLAQSDGALDLGQVVAMAQLCWSPERSNGKGKDTSRFQELAVVAGGMWQECVRNKLPPSRQGGRASFFVDLSAVANRSRIDDIPYDGKGWLDLGSECDLRALKSGRFPMASIPFEVLDEKKNDGRSVVMVENRGALDRKLPTRVEIPVNRKAASICFLHTLSRRPGWAYLSKEELCGYYYVVYDDDTYDPFEIKYVTNVANWDGKQTNWAYGPTGIALSRARLAWRGQTRSGQIAVLYAAEWINPRPTATVKKIIFASPEIKTGVKPILLAMTGYAPRPDDVEDQSIDRRIRLRPVSRIMPQEVPGNPINLSPGKILSKRLYEADNGIRISTDSKFSLSTRLGEEHQGTVANVVFDNSLAVKCEHFSVDVRIELPAPRMLSGIGIIGKYRQEHYLNDFPPSLIDYKIEISSDGEKWEHLAEVKGHIPEEEGLQVHPFGPRDVKMIRVSARNVIPLNMPRYGGQISFIQLYEPDDSGE